MMFWIVLHRLLNGYGRARRRNQLRRQIRQIPPHLRLDLGLPEDREDRLLDDLLAPSGRLSAPPRRETCRQQLPLGLRRHRT